MRHAHFQSDWICPAFSTLICCPDQVRPSTKSAKDVASLPMKNIGGIIEKHIQWFHLFCHIWSRSLPDYFLLVKYCPIAGVFLHHCHHRPESLHSRKRCSSGPMPSPTTCVFESYIFRIHNIYIYTLSGWARGVGTEWCARGALLTKWTQRSQT